VRRPILIVDGYNVIRSTPPYRDLAEDDLDAARAALVSDVGAYAHRTFDATVVFDGGGNRHSTGQPHEAAGVTVVFSPFGTEADTVIESLARKAREREEHVEVVTSDAQTQWAVLGGTVTRRSATEFSDELRTAEAEWREANPSGRRRSTVSDCIDADVRDVLSRWAHGLE